MNKFIRLVFILALLAYFSAVVLASVSDIYDFNVDKTSAMAGFKLNNTIMSEPEKLTATYQFIDDDNNSLYEYLLIQPQGSARIYDAFDDFIIATETGKIDLKELYAKKAEGPYRIIVEDEDDIYETITGNQTYLDFEKPILPDLTVELDADKIIVKASYADAFDFYLLVYESSNQTFNQKINYLKNGEEYAILYSSTENTKAFVDLKNEVEESEESNNYAVYLSSKSSAANIDEQTGSIATNPALMLKNVLSEMNDSDNIASEPLGADENGVLKDGMDAIQLAENTTERGGKQNPFTGNAVSNIGEKPSKLVGFSIMIAAGFLGLYLYNLLFKKN